MPGEKPIVDIREGSAGIFSVGKPYQSVLACDISRLVPRVRKHPKEKSMTLTSNVAGRNLGMLLLGLWLILTGLLPLLSIRTSSTVTTGLAVLGIVAGILILLKRQ